MPEPSLAFLACPANLEEPKSAIDWLKQAARQHGQRNAAQFVAVNAKFKAPSGMRTLNIGANYPTELAQLATHANWARTDQADLPQHRDALALYCLHRFIEAHPNVERIVLITESLGEDDDLASLLQGSPSAPFCWQRRDRQEPGDATIGPMVFDRTHADASAVLKMALDIALTGAIYGLDPYSCEAFLNQSTNAATLVTRGVSAEKKWGHS
ncbi:MAG: hypothetical protein J7485_04480 [Sphingobium sp.]|nr:hypothetical protein [Sphingobium sp.]